MGVLSIVTGIFEIISAATEEAPPLPACKKQGCGGNELELPGCILMCESCGVDCGDSWRNGDAKHHCCKVCAECWSMSVCMKCNKAKATRRLHNDFSLKRVHHKLRTCLYGTNKEERIGGSAVAMAGTPALFIPVVGWAVGAALIVGGTAANLAASFTAKPYVTVKCEVCQKEERAEMEQKLEEFLENGCEEWCMTCGVKSTVTSNCCLVLCDSCEI